MDSTIEAAHGGLPGWATTAFVCGALSIAVTGLPVFFTSVRLSTARWLHWGGWLSAAISFGVAASVRGWHTSVPVAALCFFLALLRAYFATPYLKIGGQVISFFPTGDTEQSTNVATGHLAHVRSTQVWWVFALLSLAVGSLPFITGLTRSLILPIAFLAFLAFIAGTDDSSRDLPFARGQKPQAIVSLIGLLPVFGIPAVGYLIGYRIGKNRPSVPGRHSSDHDPAK